ncbi:Mobile element protein [Candidatus Enterovibrio escicola]|uniref:Mobile element protein n=1 Tax=Candidatus Enterovibrio escicola TaxID=1927127 RepID=A0A2A5T096_9GAMM|nr:Mobile element protein [Candidatus Enterovibrio escacola]
MLLPHSPSGKAFVDSSKLQVYHNPRILRHQVFKGTAK